MNIRPYKMACPWNVVKFGLPCRIVNRTTNGEVQSNHIYEITKDPQSSKYEDPTDQVDAMISKPTFRWFDVVALIISIGSFLLDTGTDIFLAYCYYVDDHMWYFGLTVAFVAISSLSMTGFSLRWYIIDANLPKAPRVSPIQWVMRIIFLLLQLGPIVRYVDALLFSLKMRKHKDQQAQLRRYYLCMSYEDADAALLRLFESFLEAGPQLVLQLYIMAQPNSPNDTWILLAQCISAVISLFSLAWSLVAQHRAMRLSVEDQNVENMTIPGTFFQFLWRFFVIGARMLALGLFASLFPIPLTGILAFRWMVMIIWIMTMRTEFCDTRFEEYFYNAVLGAIFIFCYFNPKNNATRWRYTLYYIYTFVENAILISVWYAFTQPDLWYRLSAVLCHFLSFFMGLIFMVLYYLLFHPSKNIRVFRNLNPTEPNTVDHNGENNIDMVYMSSEEQMLEDDLAEDTQQPRKNKRRITRALSKDAKVDHLEISAQVHEVS